MPFSVFRLVLPTVRPPSAFPTPTLGFKSKVFAVFTGFAAVFLTEGLFDPKKSNGKTVETARPLPLHAEPGGPCHREFLHSPTGRAGALRAHTAGVLAGRNVGSDRELPWATA